MKYLPPLFVCFLLGCEAPTSAPPKALSALSDPVDRFAAIVLNSIQKRSFATNREYCGVIGYTPSGQLIASPASRGGRDGCVPKWSTQINRVIASYHTHGAATVDADTEAPSYHDILADVDQEINGYISTPGGRFWKITHKDAIARLICDEGCMHADPKHVECKAFPTRRSYTAKSLFDREMNDTGNC